MFKCPPTKPTLHLSFSPSHQNHVPRIALLQAPKKFPLHHWSFKRTIFFTKLCGLFGFLCLSHRENRKATTFLPLNLFLHLLPFIWPWTMIQVESEVPCFFNPMLFSATLSKVSLSLIHARFFVCEERTKMAEDNLRKNENP